MYIYGKEYKYIKEIIFQNKVTYSEIFVKRHQKGKGRFNINIMFLIVRYIKQWNVLTRIGFSGLFQ